MTFENDLMKHLMATKKENTAKQYINRLRKINDDQPIKSLAFLRNVEKIIDKIEKMELKQTTKIGLYTAICATLNGYNNYSKVYKSYYDVMTSSFRTYMSEVNKNEKTEQQQKSMKPMSEIIAVREKLNSEIDNTTIDKSNWKKWLQHLLISLYTYIPPRRVQDYSFLYITRDYPDGYEEDKNYYVAQTGEFIFNKYKTASSFGQQIITAPKELKFIMDRYIMQYLNKHGLSDEFPMLVNWKGELINQTNGINVLLNGALGKSVGATALRHIFVSSKFGDELQDRKKVAEMMAHSLGTAQTYIRV